MSRSGPKLMAKVGNKTRTETCSMTGRLNSTLNLLYSAYFHVERIVDGYHSLTTNNKSKVDKFYFHFPPHPPFRLHNRRHCGPT